MLAWHVALLVATERAACEMRTSHLTHQGRTCASRPLCLAPPHRLRGGSDGQAAIVRAANSSNSSHALAAEKGAAPAPTNAPRRSSAAGARGSPRPPALARGRGRGRARGARGRLPRTPRAAAHAPSSAGAAPAAELAPRAAAAPTAATPTAATPAIDPAAAAAQCSALLQALVEWRHPLLNAAVLVGASGALSAIASGRWSAASLLGALAFYALAASTGAVLLWRGAQLALARRPLLRVINGAVDGLLPAALRPGTDLLDPRAVGAIAQLCTEQLNAAFVYCKRLGSASDLTHTLGALVATFVLKVGGRYVGVPGLCWLVLVSALSIPKLKEMYGDEMTKQLSFLSYSLTAATDAMVEAVPPNLKEAISTVLASAGTVIGHRKGTPQDPE
ncbi:hypothetical protein AB1Y20_017526 [Prymnesium parvum]|uniref:Reticulon-like protein n=1 Tax=Prymnesium parvum TaxID=97485 RepID=A0AB34JKR9_PRYPA